ncbi:hypothetical protein SCATT_45640 [Streptantibioticus cattleyicolor NRRL 8057 = DSM 46488]|uniref:Uncharacterized protein n=1 Tax=Streptantibioticus cattleyicolor (strain ATCC 35852 / DSM 46488 / JCM 4925 / NBRC 14057 / NRRL 8057) TaxID=1003195 RepID=G8X0L9_STREN|nr:hypothetical protein SCATT_45640 [Streptantibioticus cattleyicolor NRRL 8057 = DSM 46488]
MVQHVSAPGDSGCDGRPRRGLPHPARMAWCGGSRGRGRRSARPVGRGSPGAS